MSRNTKIILGVIVGLVLLCACVSVVSIYIFVNSAGEIIEQAVSFSEDPAEIAQTAREIVDYDLPPGYTEQMGMNLMGFKIVGFGPEGRTNQMIMLMEFPKFTNLSQEEMEQQMQQSLQQQTGRRSMDLEVVGTTTATIRDQTVEFTIREGTDEQGNRMRQVSGVFEGKNGLVLLMAMGNAQTWDQQAIDDFIGSLR